MQHQRLRRRRWLLLECLPSACNPCQCRQQQGKWKVLPRRHHHEQLVRPTMPCARTSSSRRSACTSSSSACSLTTSGLGPAACMRCGGAVAAGPGAWASACAGGAPSPVRSITSSAGCVAGWGAGRARLRRGACCCAGQACPPAQQADSSVDSSHLLPGTVSMPHEAAACQRCPAEQSAPRCHSDHD